MSHFYVKEGKIFCEGVQIEDIVEKVPTPFYLYSYNEIIESCAEIKKAFDYAHLIAYAYKANSNTTICQIIKECGLGAEVGSLFEIYNAKRLSLPPSKVIFNGNGKSLKELEEAIKWDIFMVNVDSMEEIFLLEEVSKKYRKKVNISLRINPSLSPNTHHYIATAKKDSKFGIHIKEIEACTRYLKNSKELILSGLHIHIGSQIKDESLYVESLKIMQELRKKLENEGFSIPYINIGGGFPVEYESDEDPSLYTLSGKIKEVLDEGVKLLIEPGRRVIARAGALVLKVLYKKMGEKIFIVVDGGMNVFIRPALYGAVHRVLQVPNSRKIKADIVGPLCEEGDFLAKDTYIYEPDVGGIICILDVGAYGYTMASNYNFKPKPAEVLVKGENFYIIREPEEFDDIVRKERVLWI